MKNKNLLIFIGLLVLIAIILAIWTFIPKPVKIVRVEPVPESKNIEVSTPITVFFSQTVNLDQVYFSIEPEVLLQEKAQNEKVVILTPEQPLKGGQIYRVSVWYQQEKPLVWEFATKKGKEDYPIPEKITPSPPGIIIPSPKMTPSPGEKPKVEQVKQSIIANLPYETNGFSIQYLPNTDKFFILIKQNPYQQNKNQALAWLKKFGTKNPEKDLPLFFTSSRWVAPE